MTGRGGGLIENVTLEIIPEKKDRKRCVKILRAYTKQKEEQVQVPKAGTGL